MLSQIIFIIAMAVAVKCNGGQLNYPSSYRGMFDEIPRQSHTKGAQNPGFQFEYKVDDGVGNRQYHAQQESGTGDGGGSYSYRTVQHMSSDGGYGATDAQEEAGSQEKYVSQAKINVFPPGVSCNYGQSCMDANESGNRRSYKSARGDGGDASHYSGGGGGGGGGGDAEKSHISRGGGGATAHFSGGDRTTTSQSSGGGGGGSPTSHFSGRGGAATSHFSGGSSAATSYSSSVGGAVTSRFSGGGGVWKGKDVPSSVTSGTKYEYDPSYQGANAMKTDGRPKNDQSFEDIRLTKFTSECTCLVAGPGVKLAKNKGYKLTAVRIHNSVQLSKENREKKLSERPPDDNSVETECDCEFEANDVGRDFDRNVDAFKVSK